MLELITFCFLILAVVYYLLIRDVFHPSVIVCSFWSLLLLLYLFTNHPLWDLSDKFGIAISFWVFPFSFFAFVCGRKPLILEHSRNLYVNVRLFNNLFPYIIFLDLLFSLLIIYYAGGLSFVAIRRLLLVQDLPPALNVLFYANTFITTYVFYGLLNFEFLDKRKVLLALVLLLIVSIFKSNKTSVLSIFIGLLYVLKIRHNLKIRYLLLVVIIIVGLLVLISLNRGDFDFESDGQIQNYLYIYLLSPLTAFDLLLNGDIVLDPGVWGSGTLAFLYKLINFFGGTLEISQLGTWVNVPLPTNVFTTMRGFYLDGGFLGIFIMSCVLGIIWGGLYAFQLARNKIFLLFYAMMLGSLFFQSFGDYFFYSFSMTLQYYVFSVIMARGLIFKKRHNDSR